MEWHCLGIYTAVKYPIFHFICKPKRNIFEKSKKGKPHLFEHLRAVVVRIKIPNIKRFGGERKRNANLKRSDWNGRERGRRRKRFE